MRTTLEKEIGEAVKGTGLVIVETGTIRNAAPQYATGDGHSTLGIAEAIAKHRNGKHRFYSIDLDVSVADSVLEEHGLRKYVVLIKGNSLEELRRFDRIDFAYLDSANDAAHILAEFKIVEGKANGGMTVVVDDVYMNSSDVVKGHLVVPYAISKGYSVEIRDGQAVIKW